MQFFRQSVDFSMIIWFAGNKTHTKTTKDTDDDDDTIFKSSWELVAVSQSTGGRHFSTLVQIRLPIHVYANY